MYCTSIKAMYRRNSVAHRTLCIMPMLSQTKETKANDSIIANTAAELVFILHFEVCKCP